MIITLIRHAESQSQTQENSDLTNPDLSKNGEKQAANLATISSDDYDEIWISPLSRTTKTFELSKFSAPILKYDTRLLEFWHPEDYLRHLPIEIPDIASEDVYNVWEGDGEERVEAVIESLKELGNKKICLFTHQAWIRSFLDKLFSDKYSMSKKIVIDNCSQTIIELKSDGKSKVIKLNNRLKGDLQCK